MPEQQPMSMGCPRYTRRRMPGGDATQQDPLNPSTKAGSNRHDDQAQVFAVIDDERRLLSLPKGVEVILSTAPVRALPG
jgi:hypothetical protein